MAKKIYILAPYPKGEAPSQRFRFEQYLEHIEREGYSIQYYPFLSEKTWRILYQEGGTMRKVFGILGGFWRRFTLLFRLVNADRILIHREASMIGPPVFEWIIAKVLRKKYIFDFDDAIWLPNYSDSNARFNRLKSYWKVKWIIKWAAKVSAGNDFLRAYALNYNSNVSIIPTTIDLQNAHNKITNYITSEITIGWTGTHTTMHYIKPLIPVLKELEKEHDFTFTVISNQPPNFDLKSLRFIKWNKKTEIHDLAQLTIGVMPLEESPWAEGKCGFKGLQYMALGIPAILSPVGVNNAIIENGVNGFLCSSYEEWKNQLYKLIISAELRQKIGMQGRKTVEQHYSVESNWENYKNLLEL